MKFKVTQGHWESAFRQITYTFLSLHIILCVTSTSTHSVAHQSLACAAARYVTRPFCCVACNRTVASSVLCLSMGWLIFYEAVFHYLHCALASCGAVYCNRSCLWVCDSGRAGGRCPNLRARSVCVSLSAFFIGYCVRLFLFSVLFFYFFKCKMKHPVIFSIGCYC